VSYTYARMPEQHEESLSSRALAAYVKEHGAGFVVEKTQIHRTQLWRYATGRGKPDAEQVAKLHRVSEGRVAADGWETLSAAALSAASSPERITVLDEPKDVA